MSREFIRNLTQDKTFNTVWVVKYGKSSYDIFSSRSDAIRFHPTSSPIKIKDKNERTN